MCPTHRLPDALTPDSVNAANASLNDERDA